MPIPPILAYPMPTEAPPTPIGWRPDPRRAALLIHDMQRYFVRCFPAGDDPVRTLIANIRTVRRAAAAHGIPVFYSAQPGGLSRAERGLNHDLWGPGMRAVAHERDIVTELTPARGDVIIRKTRYSAFHGTRLADELAARRRDQLIVCGVFAQLGCLLTAADAFARDIEAFLLADAVADFGPDEHRTALAWAARGCAVPLTTARLVSTLASAARPLVPGTPARRGR